MLVAGTKVGPYQIVGLLGAGGMGEVYRARDAKLARDVALKVLPEAVAGDADRVARFGREAKTLAALNHPHIAQIYGFEESSGTRALVMELVDGEDLAARLRRGRLPVDEVGPIAQQLAEALSAAHGHGVIHRDLKPANIKIRSDGTVKVLDFGLAKAFDRSGDTGPEISASAANSPTITTPAMTQTGVILGTAAYMSPEQARGKPVDKRADIWAYGCVLYEMLTGVRAFEGEGVNDTLAKILGANVDLQRLPPETPPGMRVVIVACLQRDPAQRIHDIADLRLLMSGAFEAAARPAEASARRPLWWQRPAFAALLASLALGGWSLAGWTWSRPGAAPTQPLIRLGLPLQAGDNLAVVSRLAVRPAVSPDGRLVVYASRRDGVSRLYQRPLDRLAATPIPGTEGAVFPFFSPDGEWVGFWADARLKKVPLAGGEPIVVTSARVEAAGHWGDDDNIVFAEFTSGGGVYRVPATGGNAQAITEVNISRGDNFHLGPHVLPGGRDVLYSVTPTSRVVAINLNTGEEKDLIAGDWPQYVPSGHLVFLRGNSLWAAPFDRNRLAVTGTEVRLLDGVVGPPVVSRDGMLIYLSGEPQLVKLVWVDRQGREDPLDLEPAPIIDVAVSPDGRKIALSTGIFTDRREIVIADLSRHTTTQLTTPATLNTLPLWSRDGVHLAYSSNLEGPRVVYWRRADGNGQPERLTRSAYQQSPWGWSSDGQTLVVQQLRPQTSWDITAVALDGGSETILVETPGLDLDSAVSPDGRWLAYTSSASGPYQIMVRPFPNVHENSWQVSTAGGREARWSRDGRELFYREGSSIMRVPVDAGSTFQPGRPQLLLKGDYIQTQGSRLWDIGPDGRFLMQKEVPADYSLNVVLGWVDELKTRVPSRPLP